MSTPWVERGCTSRPPAPAISGSTCIPRSARAAASASGSGASSISAYSPSPRRSRNFRSTWLRGLSGSAGDMSSMLLPPPGTHMATRAPRLGTVRSAKSSTGIPNTSRNVDTAPSKSSTAMAIRGIAVIMGACLSDELAPILVPAGRPAPPASSRYRSEPRPERRLSWPLPFYQRSDAPSREVRPLTPTYEWNNGLVDPADPLRVPGRPPGDPGLASKDRPAGARPRRRSDRVPGGARRGSRDGARS